MAGQQPNTNPYQEFTFTIPAQANGNNRQKIYYDTTYFRILALTLNTVSVNFGGTGPTSTIIGAGIGIKLIGSIPWVELTNTGAADLTVTVALGHIGDVFDSRFTVSGTINTTITPGGTLIDTADVVVATATATKVITGNAANKTVIISNPVGSGVTMRVGSLNVGAARGIPVLEGGSVSLDTTADVWVYQASGGNVSIPNLVIRT